MNTNLVKIYEPSCDVCRLLRGMDEDIASMNGFFFRQLTVTECATTPGPLRDYVVAYHLDSDGSIDIPVYLITKGGQDEVQASGLIKTIQELQNLVQAWESYQK